VLLNFDLGNLMQQTGPLGAGAGIGRRGREGVPLAPAGGPAQENRVTNRPRRAAAWSDTSLPLLDTILTRDVPNLTRGLRAGR